MHTEYLRPLERRVLAMREAGMSTAEIARRLNKSPQHTARIQRWIDIPRTRPAPERYPAAVEARVKALRRDGVPTDEIGERFGRSAGFADRIERLAALREA